MGKRVENVYVDLENGTTAIFLMHDQVALIDTVDVDLVKQHQWNARWSVCAKKWYVYTNIWINKKVKSLALHTLLMGTDCPTVDHINGFSIDNRRANLRSATYGQNRYNRPGSGVYFYDGPGRRKRWCAHISHEGKVYRKYYTDRSSARECRLIMEQVCYGDFRKEVA